MKAKKSKSPTEFRIQVTQSEFDVSFYLPVINGLTECIRDFCVHAILGRLARNWFLEVISSAAAASVLATHIDLRAEQSQKAAVSCQMLICNKLCLPHCVRIISNRFESNGIECVYNYIGFVANFTFFPFFRCDMCREFQNKRPFAMPIQRAFLLLLLFLGLPARHILIHEGMFKYACLWYMAT